LSTELSEELQNPSDDKVYHPMDALKRF